MSRWKKIVYVVLVVLIVMFGFREYHATCMVLMAVFFAIPCDCVMCRLNRNND